MVLLPLVAIDCTVLGPMLFQFHVPAPSVNAPALIGVATLTVPEPVLVMAGRI
jgi:hypothetical protein